MLYLFIFRFDFVKTIGKNLNNINLPQGTALTAKILLGIVKQGPIYLSPRLAIVSIYCNILYYNYMACIT
jgi:hypothetical protein